MKPTLRSTIIRVSLVSLAWLIFSVAAYGQSKYIDLRPVNKIIERWKEDHNSRDSADLKRLYADSVVAYGSRLIKTDFLSRKSARLRSANYRLEILTKPVFSNVKSNSIKATFLTRNVSGKKTNEFESYLVFREVTGEWLISEEGDLDIDVPESVVHKFKRTLASKRASEVILAIVVMAIFVMAVVYVKRRKNKEEPETDLLPVEDMPVTTASIPTEETRSKFAEDGRKFENFVVDFFNRANKLEQKYFVLTTWQGDKIHNGIYARANMDPDLIYEFRGSTLTREFAIECKYRSRLPENVFRIERRKLDNYLRFEKKRKIPVSIVLGLKGEPDRPAELYIIPLSRFRLADEIHYDNIGDCYHAPHKIFDIATNKGKPWTWMRF